MGREFGKGRGASVLLVLTMFLVFVVVDGDLERLDV
jgi:hypothetical protein